MQISTQSDNHKYKKNAIKKVLFKKMRLKFRNPNFKILIKIAFMFLIKYQPFGVQSLIRPFWNK